MRQCNNVINKIYLKKRENRPKHIIIKLLKISDKGKILKSHQGKYALCIAQ